MNDRNEKFRDMAHAGQALYENVKQQFACKDCEGTLRIEGWHNPSVPCGRCKGTGIDPFYQDIPPILQAWDKALQGHITNIQELATELCRKQKPERKKPCGWCLDFVERCFSAAQQSSWQELDLETVEG